MISPDVQKLIDEGIDILNTNKSVSPAQAEKNATKFLFLAAKLARAKYDIEQEKITTVSLERAVEAREMMKHTDKKITITEKKLLAETNDEYQVVREDMETKETDISFLKTMIDLFQNAHVQNRQLIRNI